MGIFTLKPGERLRFDYLNHRDVLEKRDAIFQGLDYGDNEWYPEPQWFMRCYDIDRDADRSFALSRIDGRAIIVVHLAMPKGAPPPWLETR